MIAKGLITQRANDEHLPAQTIERDYVLAHLCAEIGAMSDDRLVFKGGTRAARFCASATSRTTATPPISISPPQMISPLPMH